MVAITPGLAETLARDWRKAARFYARFGIMEKQLRQRAPPGESTFQSGPHGDLLAFTVDTRTESRSRGGTIFLWVGSQSRIMQGVPGESLRSQPDRLGRSCLRLVVAPTTTPTNRTINPDTRIPSGKGNHPEGKLAPQTPPLT